MNSPLLQLFVRWVVLALGVTLATKIVPGIECRDGTTLLVVVLLLSFFNAILRPLLVLFTLPFIVFTLGLGVLLINAFLFLLVGEIVQGFFVESFWSALGGSLIVSVTNLILTSFTRRMNPPPPPDAPPTSPRQNPAKKPKSDDVIDI